MIAALAAVSVSALALLALGGSVLLIRTLSPASVAGAIAVVRALPPIPLAFLVMLAAPIVAFDVALGLWLLVKCVRVPEHTRLAR